ncbi:hypothetical protein K402DRAFT_252186 [Aulographum hederae CBS 113979]|uniref:Uncharacterized protein n=1 Tax=Aulographum hederae CBS 113979 TaxID=1176131 RepID=A0A6G1GJF3_9PEZI|nr:hypothetical protein K402DRAFT_252186 [Aulographum hederae CBS 113979]
MEEVYLCSADFWMGFGTGSSLGQKSLCFPLQIWPSAKWIHIWKNYSFWVKSSTAERAMASFRHLHVPQHGSHSFKLPSPYSATSTYLPLLDRVWVKLGSRVARTSGVRSFYINIVDAETCSMLLLAGSNIEWNLLCQTEQPNRWVRLRYFDQLNMKSLIVLAIIMPSRLYLEGDPFPRQMRDGRKVQLLQLPRRSPASIPVEQSRVCKIFGYGTLCPHSGSRRGTHALSRNGS